MKGVFKMKENSLLFLTLALVIILTGCGEKDNSAPYVVNTFPENGSQDVDPSVNELSVTFNEAMMDGNWSWAYTKISEFPTMRGDPHYTENYTTNILPVKLEPNKEYVIWLNSEKFQNFKDRSGNPLVPFKLAFKTR